MRVAKLHLGSVTMTDAGWKVAPPRCHDDGCALQKVAPPGVMLMDAHRKVASQELMRVAKLHRRVVMMVDARRGMMIDVGRTVAPLWSHDDGRVSHSCTLAVSR